jgi:hypothetical protein
MDDAGYCQRAQPRLIFHQPLTTELLTQPKPTIQTLHRYALAPDGVKSAFVKSELVTVVLT